MNNMFKSSDLLKELAPSQGEAVYFLYFSHMAEKIDLIRNWASPVSGKFGFLQQYLANATFISIDMMNLHESLIFDKETDVLILLPSFEDFRAFALAEYASAIDRQRGNWGKIARSLRHDYVKGYHYFVITRILDSFLPFAEVGDPEFELVVYQAVRDITDIYFKYDKVKVGRLGFGQLRNSNPLYAFSRFGLDPDVLLSKYNYHARRFSVLPFGPLLADIEHVFRINSINAND